MSTPEVSVIVCVRNGADTILRQLRALDSQHNAPKFEIIVVDNGSTDTTSAVVAGWLHDPARPAVPARLVSAAERAHIPYARNRGALASRGRILAYCDADDEADPLWLAALTGCLDQDGIAGGRILARTAEGVPQPGVFPEALVATHYLPHAGNANLALTRACFIAIGGYDESLPRYGYEDVDISWRAQEQGFPIGYCGGAVMNFTLASRSAAVRKQFLIAKGRVLISIRHPAAFRPFTLTGCLRVLGGRLAALPYRMVRPGPHRRSRHLAWVVNAFGNLAGWWTYVFRGAHASPVLLTPSDFAAAATA
ncbi:glycosyltransferase family 2 protein [uncultured Microbacterium sp.]|uniref:glycosyltransferase family 2 protein n=1 Tax=uncultured Microbacterium sp. TaxID=191216 RepID=UPI0026050E39|nr:glycosyltransferase family A protein [uncultured Microbacterium sp.]